MKSGWSHFMIGMLVGEAISCAIVEMWAATALAGIAALVLTVLTTTPESWSLK